ncbi:MAG TPA: c-type cytochrome [Methyloprofundus sp.]|uniref:c-type cytochrome n=1 Tax=Methyloprofundus sp. TaxID=2020875 RepID=UPI0018291B13|nr:c-type cytochrome [Methyloprofundus sp.]HIG64174.1 c-type cytochrome [Methyloprofundus sp.]HIL77338.1 c-type cytochrome [Methylococcales bacterium]
MNNKAMVMAIGLTALSNIQLTAQAADVDAGRDAFETCRGCHSSPGYSNVYPTYYVPKIGGQVARYTVAALTAYKESNRPRGTMMANSYDLSEKKIENIAAYLATVTDGSTRANANGGDAANGEKLAATCLACHNDDTNAGATNPRLAGQHANYMERAMQQYQSGARNNALMQSTLEGLSADELKDIAAYFTSLKGLTATN